MPSVAGVVRDSSGAEASAEVRTGEIAKIRVWRCKVAGLVCVVLRVRIGSRLRWNKLKLRRGSACVVVFTELRSWSYASSNNRARDAADAGQRGRGQAVQRRRCVVKRQTASFCCAEPAQDNTAGDSASSALTGATLVCWQCCLSHDCCFGRSERRTIEPKVGLICWRSSASTAD